MKNKVFFLLVLSTLYATTALAQFKISKGLKIQVLLVNDPADQEEAESVGVDFIQTGNF